MIVDRCENLFINQPTYAELVDLAVSMRAELAALRAENETLKARVADGPAGASVAASLRTSLTLSGLAPSVTHSLAVSAQFADGTSLASGAISFNAPMLCSDGVTVAVAASCPTVPPPPGP